MFIDIITVAAFLAIFLTAFLIADLLTHRRRLRYPLPAIDEVTGDKPANHRKRSQAGALTQAFTTVIPQSANEVARIDHDLKQAGYYRSTALVEYLAVRNLLVIAVLITAGVLAVLSDPGTPIPETMLVLGVLGAIFGYGLPRMVVHLQANRRVDRIQKGLPDALDLLSMCITGGMTIQKSMQQVARELKLSHPDVAIEFEIIRRHSDADSMGRALKQFSNRIDTPDVNALSALVSQTERMGTNVATAICDYADSVRRAHRQRAEERANKTSIKMLFPVIICLAPPIYILLCGPPAIKLYTFVKEAHQSGGVLDPATLSSADPLPPSEEMDRIMAERRERVVSERRERSAFEASADPQFEQTLERAQGVESR